MCSSNLQVPPFKKSLLRSPGPALSLSTLRLLVPPIRLVSAAIWQTLELKIVSDYGLLEEFVFMVTEIVPQLLSARQRAELILGLRARVRICLVLQSQTQFFFFIVWCLPRQYCWGGKCPTTWVDDTFMSCSNLLNMNMFSHHKWKPSSLLRFCFYASCSDYF